MPKLTRKEERDVEQYILKNGTSIINGVLSVDTLTTNLSKQLNKVITKHNVKVAAAIVGVQIPQRKKVSPLKIEGAVRLIAVSLVDLLKQLNCEVSPELLELTNPDYYHK